MTGVKISNLPAATTPLTGAELVPIVQSGGTAQTSVDNVLAVEAVRLAASGGAALMGYLPAGTGAVATTVQTKLRESVSVKDFGAVGDGVTDDTVAIQAAINYTTILGDDVPVFFPEGSYAVTNLVMGAYTKLIGYGATLVLLSGVGPIISHNPGTGLQTAQYGLVQGLVFDGVSTAANSVGIYTTSPSLITRDVRTTRLETGVSIVNGQFQTHYTLKAYDCTVGLYIESTVAGGGGNSLSFYDFQGIGCRVGTVLNTLGIYPHHSIYFRNPSWLQNTVSGFASFGTTSYVDGNANEGNGTAASLTYNSLTILKSSTYISNSTCIFTNCSFQEASVNPCIIAVSGSKATFTNSGGYGISTGRFYSADSTSSCSIFGFSAFAGSLNNVSTNFCDIQSTSVLFCGAPVINETASIQNLETFPQRGVIADANGTVASGPGRDAVFGDYYYATFPATASGRMRYTTPTVSGALSIRCLVYADVAVDLIFGLFGNVGNKLVKLSPGWNSVHWIYNTGALASAVYSFVITNSDTVSATIQVCKFQTNAGTDSVIYRNTISAVASGAYNPNIKVLKQIQEGTAAPTSSTWAVGDVVWHSTPAASGNIGWVCTTAGTPGTWKTFGAIAA